MMQNCFRFKNPILLMALAAAYPIIGYGASAARVDFASGPVTAVSANGVQRPLTKGAEISNGDTISTGTDGRAQLRFSDGAMMSLQPQTEFRIDDYNYSGRNDGQEKGFFNLLRGGLRTITGLIGKGNRDAYRVTTQVATIGIRGTEYSATYTSASNDGLIVHTGEGRIEVCNAGGCILVANGESALISGRNQAPTRTENRPLLQPAQPTTDVIEITATGETRTTTGGIAPFTAPLLSGQYAGALAGLRGSSPTLVSTSGSQPAIFGSNSELQSIVAGFDTYSAQNVKAAFSADGVIGWGVWSSGTAVYFSSDTLTNMHYVVGQATSASDISALQAANFSATYQLIGFTLPTSTSGVVGGAPSGTLTANFSSGISASISTNLNLSVPIGGSTYVISASGSNLGSSPQFNGAGSFSSSFQGFFAGSNASYAGLAYQFNATGLGEQVSGAAAFKR